MFFDFLVAFFSTFLYHHLQLILQPFTKNDMIDILSREGPLLAVACGRDTISTASSIKRLASENVFVVQVCRLHVY